jgi:hypothetical protein
MVKIFVGCVLHTTNAAMKANDAINAIGCHFRLCGVHSAPYDYRSSCQLERSALCFVEKPLVIFHNSTKRNGGIWGTNVNICSVLRVLCPRLLRFAKANSMGVSFDVLSTVSRGFCSSRSDTRRFLNLLSAYSRYTGESCPS